MSKREIKFFQTEEFKELHRLWVSGPESKIVKSGFEDAEYANETLKTKNNRTQSYHQQETIFRISTAIGYYVENPSTKLKRFEKAILELHSQGIYNKEIIRITKKSHQTVWKTIKVHIPLALGVYAKLEALEGEEVELLLENVEIVRRDLERMEPCHIREALADELNFIYATWLNSYQGDSVIGHMCSKQVFFNEYPSIIDEILSREKTKTFVAFVPESPTIILSYIVFEKDVLHYAFTKEIYRKNGLIKILLKSAFKEEPIEFTHRTTMGEPVINKYRNRMTYNPFKLYEKMKAEGIAYEQKFKS